MDAARGVWRRLPRRLRTALPWVLACGVLVLLVGRLRQQGALGSGEPAPAFVLPLSDGRTLSLKALRGKTVVLNFWASWCPPCRAEMPALSRVHRRHAGRGVEFVGVSLDRAAAGQVARAALQLGASFPVALAQPQLVEAYNVRALPTTYIIGPDGRVRWSHVGPVDDDDLNRQLDD